jgi:hypothetical protein
VKYIVIGLRIKNKTKQTIIKLEHGRIAASDDSQKKRKKLRGLVPLYCRDSIRFYIYATEIASATKKETYAAMALLLIEECNEEYYEEEFAI